LIILIITRNTRILDTVQQNSCLEVDSCSASQSYLTHAQYFVTGAYPWTKWIQSIYSNNTYPTCKYSKIATL
jgi:hypothetical protein